jgi:hypothetical protein
LLTLRREDNDAPTGLLNLLDHFAQNKTFACARAATKDRNLVR